jgi:hypothetical protein
MLILNLEFNHIFIDQDYPNIVLVSIDNDNVYVLPKIHRMSDNILTYTFRDNNILNKVVNNNIIFNIIYTENKLDIGKISYRSI